MEEKTKKILNYKKILIISSLLIFSYIIISLHFIRHFNLGTEINYIDVSNKTLEEAKKEILEKTSDYSIKLEEKDNKSEEIFGKDIELKYDLENKIEELKRNQNHFTWIEGIFKHKQYIINDCVSYNEELLKEIINKLECISGDSIIESENPKLIYGNKQYYINEEVYGTKINYEILYNNLINFIASGEKSIDLEKTNCYEKPMYKKDDKEVINAKKILDKYVNSEITYTFGNNIEVVNGDLISNWIKINSDYKIMLDESKVYTYIKKLSSIYDTVGKKREFKTSLGIKSEVTGGNYGWKIDIFKEMNELIKDIQNEEKLKKEPIYKQVAASHDKNDIGDTYIEINIEKQHLWFYRNKILVVEGDIVTGNLSKGNSTPKGVYMLNYKEKNAILKGEGYTTPVNFWMPFNGGIGIHDAGWRSSFGGNIYKTNGSHGCVNVPYYLAKVLFDSIDVKEGIPIICYS